jgi:hypothetical protein
MLPACFDAETWLYLWDINPRDDRERLFLALQSRLHQKEILIPEEVLREIESKNEALHLWLKAHGESIVPLNEAIESEVMQLLAQFPVLIDPDQIGFQSDVFLLATVIQQELKIVSIRKGWQSVIDRYDIDAICAAVGVDLQMLPPFNSLLTVQRSR